MNEHLERYKLIFEHFKLMELRYHTWMNYYSLFNGALLVAYCTILVSTGRIVEKASYAMPMESDSAKGRELFSLECTYWEFLVLIAALGILAGFCWLRSMQGHRAWLDSWRTALQNEGWEFDRTIYVDDNTYSNETDNQKVIHGLELYSTAKITVLFIKGVIVSWTLAGAYAVWSVCLNLERGNLCLLIVLTVILIVSLWVGFRYTKKESNVDGFALNRVSFSDETPGNTSIRNQVAHVLNIVARLLESYIR